MIVKGKKLFPKIIVKHGDAMDNLTFEPSSFTHITCLFFTFYYLPDQEGFLRICNNWLEYNGYLGLHLVDREKFNPIVPLDEVTVKNTNHVNARQVNIESLIRFKNFNLKLTGCVDQNGWVSLCFMYKSTINTKQIKKVIIDVYPTRRYGKYDNVFFK